MKADKEVADHPESRRVPPQSPPVYPRCDHRSGARDELLLLEPHRRTRYPQARSATRSQSAHRRPGMDRHTGEFRTRYIQVGSHVAMRPGALPRFMQRFQQVYANLGKTESIISTAAAHHRGPADVARHDAGIARHRRGMVGGARSRPPCGRLQEAARQLRSPPPQRSRRPGIAKRGSARTAS